MATRPRGKPAALRFGPLPFNAEALIAGFTPEATLQALLAQELSAARGVAVSSAEAESTYRALVATAARDAVMDHLERAEVYARGIFSTERVPLDEAKARDIVVQYARGERYVDAKELVIAAATFVRVQELRRHLNSDNGIASTHAGWEVIELAIDLTTWATAAGLYREFEVRRSPAHATAKRSANRDIRVQQLTDAVRAQRVKPSARAVVQWRGEAATSGNLERARRDLRAAGFTSARRRPGKLRKRE